MEQFVVTPDITGAVAPGTTPVVPAAPEVLIAGKYKTEADLEQGIMEMVRMQHKDVGAKEAYYKSLESSIGKPPVVEAPVVTPDPNAPAPDLTITPAPTEIKPVDFQKYTQEYTDNQGVLKPETYQEIQKAYNLDKPTVDMWIEGQKALAEVHTSKVFERAGGQQSYMDMITWAQGNLTPAEQTEFNNTISNRDPAKWGTAIDALTMRYTRANGNTPKTIVGGQGDVGGSGGYSSRAQMIADMNNPQYQKDESFRTMVRNKIQRKTF